MMQKRAIITREKILESALEQFAKSGFHGARIDVIADEAGVNKQRIYAYYDSKEKLFTVCLKKVFEIINPLEGEAVDRAEANPAQLTDILFRSYLELHRRYPRFHRLLAWANLEDMSLAPGTLIDVKQQNYARSKQIFEKAVAGKMIIDGVSFETYIFNLTASSFFYHSNRRTLSQTLGDAIFSDAGLEKYISETVNLYKP